MKKIITIILLIIAVQKVSAQNPIVYEDFYMEESLDLFVAADSSKKETTYYGMSATLRIGSPLIFGVLGDMFSDQTYLSIGDARLADGYTVEAEFLMGYPYMVGMAGYAEYGMGFTRGGSPENFGIFLGARAYFHTLAGIGTSPIISLQWKNTQLKLGATFSEVYYIVEGSEAYSLGLRFFKPDVNINGDPSNKNMYIAFSFVNPF
ncbi:hypothetical protein EP331_06545 [bacterium]|nr:MAG: hypothetical protein EP331_06545 [bacterium]